MHRLLVPSQRGHRFGRWESEALVAAFLAVSPFPTAHIQSPTETIHV